MKAKVGAAAANQGHMELPEARAGKEGFFTRTFSRKMALLAGLLS